MTRRLSEIESADWYGRALTARNGHGLQSGRDWVALGYALSTRSYLLFLQSLGQPHLDEGLARDAESSGFLIDGPEHPAWEIYIDSLRVHAGAPGLGQVEVAGEVLTLIEFLIKFSRF